MRSDFLMRLVALPEIGDLVSRALYLLRPLSESGLCAAIVEPARATGISFDSVALIERLVTSTAATANGLPLAHIHLSQAEPAPERAQATISPQPLHSICRLKADQG